MIAFSPARLAGMAVALTLGFTALAQPVDVFPVRSGPSAQSLNGRWQFKYLAGSDAGADAAFSDPTFAGASAWQPIAVPGHWELQGFAEPKYGGKLADGTGLYRRIFRTADAWRGQRVFLRFDGVLYGFDAWVNGVKVGTWASAYNACTFDITDALKFGADNVLAVQVTTRDKGWEFDTNDCWSLSGIYRDVTLFAVPATHFTDYMARTTLAADGSAELTVDVVASQTATVSGRLLTPSGELVREFQIPLGPDARGRATVTVVQPQLWTAETPSLYRLELALQAGGQTVQRIAEKIGLRQITTDGGVLKLNGRPIKLRGADHHDIWPDVGRAATEEHLRRDLALIKAANINFIRTSHYPPHPRFIELCDELGIYVMCEVPFGFGDSHLTDESYQDILLTRARATVRRDKNRPSVIVWSVGNENPITPIQLETGREVKRLDPTRPICFPTVGSYFARNYEKFPEFVDIYAPHYPVVSTLRDFAQKLTRPIIVTEYAHQLGLASDRVQEEWEIMQASPRIAGGAVWMFQDQGILRTSEKSASEAAPNPYVWLDEHRYFDTNNLDGMDGIVYSDRTPQVDYWQVRKVYSPVQIVEHTLTATAGPQPLTLHVENRFDFRALTGFKLAWSLKKNGIAVQSGTAPLHAAAHATEAVSLAVTVPEDFSRNYCVLELRCLDESGQSPYERAIRLDPAAKAAPAADLFAVLKPTALELSESSAEIRVTHPRFTVTLNRQSGALVIRNPAGVTVAEGVYPHVGRRFTEAETLRAKTASLWAGAFLRDPADLETEATRTEAGVRLRIRGKYARTDTPGQFIEGEQTLLITPAGAIDLAYDYTPVNATGTFLEAGVSLVLPAASSEFRWGGQGPFAGYPGKDRLNEFGVYHLSRDDISFQGNRREVDLALLTNNVGEGVLLSLGAADVAVENTTEGIVLSQNALLSGRGNKGVGPETSINAAEVTHIAGKFTLLPVGADWPAPLARWFGGPTESVPVHRPFLRSYDQ